jgi:hypothetical protein
LGGFAISIEVRKRVEFPECFEEFWEFLAINVAFLSKINGIKDSQELELIINEFLLENFGFFLVVWLDTPEKMALGPFQFCN